MLLSIARVFHTSRSAPTHPVLSGTPLQRKFRLRRSESPLPRGVARSDGVCESTMRGCRICGLALLNWFIGCPLLLHCQCRAHGGANGCANAHSEGDVFQGHAEPCANPRAHTYGYRENHR